MDRLDLLQAVWSHSPAKAGWPPQTSEAIASRLGLDEAEVEVEAALQKARAEGLVGGRRDEYWYFWSLSREGQAERKRLLAERDPEAAAREERDRARQARPARGLRRWLSR